MCEFGQLIERPSRGWISLYVVTIYVLMDCWLEEILIYFRGPVAPPNKCHSLSYTYIHIMTIRCWRWETFSPKPNPLPPLSQRARNKIIVTRSINMYGNWVERFRSPSTYKDSCPVVSDSQRDGDDNTIIIIWNALVWVSNGYVVFATIKTKRWFI